MSRFNWDEDTSIEQAVFEALGAVSVCWENIAEAGVFQSGSAIEIGHELTDFIKARTA